MKTNQQNDFELRVCPQAITLKRAEAEGKRPKVSGYAAIFGQRSNPIWGVIEVIEAGAFDDILDNDVRALINHEGLPLARTKSGTLSIGVDKTGLFFEFEAPDTERGNELVTLIERGDVAECSFAFRLDPSGYRYVEEDGMLIRYISHVAALRDVSLVTYPAYPQTSADVQRSAETAKEPQGSPDAAKAAAFYAEALAR